jgi:hypothetical protein
VSNDSNLERAVAHLLVISEQYLDKLRVGRIGEKVRAEQQTPTGKRECRTKLDFEHD